MYTFAKEFGWTAEQVWDMSEFEIGIYMTEIRRQRLDDGVDSYLAQGKEGKKALNKLSKDDPIRRRYDFRIMERAIRKDKHTTKADKAGSLIATAEILKKIRKEKQGR